MPAASDILVYGSVLIAIALGFIVAALIVLYIRVLNNYRKLKEQKTQFAQAAQKQAEVLLGNAQKSAEKIINEAHLKAAEVIKSTEVLSADSKKTMLAELEKVSSENIASFRQALETSKKELGTVLAEVARDLKSQALTEVESFKGVLQKEIVNSQSALKEATEIGYKKIEEEILRYRQARLAQIDATIFEILREVTRNIIGKAISFEEHEELVKKSLEEAKRQNAFEENTSANSEEDKGKG